MMNEDIKKERMERFGCITYCADRDTMCFGILTADGRCKYDTCLHDDPNWIAQQKRIEEKRKAAMESQVVITEEMEVKKEALKPKTEILDFDAEREKIRKLEAKARALYFAGERKEADRVFNRAKRARKALWNKTNE